MIDYIEITFSNTTTIKEEIKIDCKNEICLINDKEKRITKDTINSLLKMIINWKNEYGNSNNIDAEEFFVKIYENGKINTFHGKGTYPNDYIFFKQLLGDIYE